MSFSDGDFVKVEYSLWREADGQLMRTTEKKVAEEGGIYNSEVRYSPQLIIIGKDNALRALWEAIKGMSVGESRTLRLEPKDAFGERDPGLVRVMPVADFRRREIEPRPGLQIDIDGVIATVKSVNSGRVMIDANNQLAGERIRYEIRVVSKIDTEDGKIKAISETYGLVPSEVHIKDGVAKIVFGSETKIDADFFLNKTYLVHAVLEYLESIKRIEIVEEHEREWEKAK